MSATNVRKSAKADLRRGPSCESALDSRFRGKARSKAVRLNSRRLVMDARVKPAHDAEILAASSHHRFTFQTACALRACPLRATHAQSPVLFERPRV